MGALDGLSDIGRMFLVTLLPKLGGTIGLFFYADWINFKFGLLKVTNDSLYSVDSHKKVIEATLNESFREDLVDEESINQ